MISSIHEFVAACKKLAEARQHPKEDQPVKWFRNLTAERGKYYDKN